MVCSGRREGQNSGLVQYDLEAKRMPLAGSGACPVKVRQAGKARTGMPFDLSTAGIVVNERQCNSKQYILERVQTPRVTLHYLSLIKFFQSGSCRPDPFLPPICNASPFIRKCQIVV